MCRRALDACRAFQTVEKIINYLTRTTFLFVLFKQKEKASYEVKHSERLRVAYVLHCEGPSGSTVNVADVPIVFSK